MVVGVNADRSKRSKLGDIDDRADKGPPCSKENEEEGVNTIVTHSIGSLAAAGRELALKWSRADHELRFSVTNRDRRRCAVDSKSER